MSTEIRASSQASMLLYGVWIVGQGWLRGENRNPVAFDLQEVADSAANLWNVQQLPAGERLPNPALVLPFDHSLVDVEEQLKKREAAQAQKILALAAAPPPLWMWWRRLRRF